MKFIKYALLSIVGLVLILGVVGYIFIRQELKPPPNYLVVAEEKDKIPITWTANEHSNIAALLLPVTLAGVDQKLYMQFDLGSQSTIFYKKTLEDIQRLYPHLSFKMDSTDHLQNFSFNLGSIHISAEKFRAINYGDGIDLNDSSATHIIGTIGADLIEKKITLLDFINNMVHFGNTFDDKENDEMLHDFSFDNRMVLLPAFVNGKNQKLWYDTGTSGFDFITNKSTWEYMSKPGAAPVAFDANSWGTALKTHTIASDKTIYFDSTEVALQTVTYVEGYAFLSEILARSTGMGGLIGNKLFMGKQVVLDGANQKFAVFNEDIVDALK